MAYRVSVLMRRATLAATAIAGLSVAAHAQAPARVGLLSCDISGGAGFVITSSKALDCSFQPENGGPPEHYLGTVQKFGLDIGFTGPGKLAWGVFSGTSGYGPGALAGTYSGASAGATVVAGLGANVLVGGSGQTFSFQPLSVQGQTGLNVSAGVGQIVLEYVPMAPPPAPRKRRHRHH
jgi:hypothetical protein